MQGLNPVRDKIYLHYSDNPKDIESQYYNMCFLYVLLITISH